MDWAMKFLPWIDREKQTDFYGKKCINWHVSVVLSRNERSQISTDCYVHLFNSIPQGWFAVASILENVLHCIKIQNDKITKVYLRSDNAACYHCSPLIASIHGISERTGINICRYDFSEAQSGKDICDRRTAPMKIHAKRFGNEGHDITTAEELKIVLESYGGIQDSHVYTAEVNFDHQNVKKCSIPGINMFNNFKFEDTGIRMWLGYGIGEGKFVSYNSLSSTSQGDTNLTILEHPMVTKRGNTCQRKRKFKETLPNQEEASIHVVNEVMDVEDEVTDVVDEYTCGECGVAFTSLKDYNIHQDIGNHNMTSSDHVKILWTRKCVGIKEKVTKHPSLSEIENACAQRNLVKGWALKGKRISKRFNKKVKDFVAQLFKEGERTGRKYTPTEASKKLRTARDEDGSRTFSPEEWLSSQQVQGLFCRFDKKSNFVVEPKEETDED
ncbi:uncharacterized protein LOC130052907 [Ostrea edulis]|uniref:uncharacterized protein LOC130052907 n=1 Tax=Ostrea edulis TaxID=37623 RepID=UPI0024AFDC99|nr:uncharacterized protein LOC130052907 [Ostrea edulis]XP_056015082.1 uncharacterized protein LOC130052907 [Ostrea edulis]